eukprot:gene7038-11203_t
MNNNIKEELQKFYFLDFNTLIIPKNAKQVKEVSVSTESLLFHLLLRYEIKDLQKFKQYPEIIEQASKFILQQSKFVSQIEKDILNGSFFEQRDYKTFQEYLDSIEDEQLLKRIQQISLESDECYICFDNEAKHITSCSHSICEECFSKLSSSQCPFCRTKNISLFLKSEIQNKNVDEEEKIKEKKVTKKLNLIYDFDSFIQKRLRSLFSMGTGKLNLSNMNEIKTLIQYYDVDVVLNAFNNQKKFSNEELVFYFIGQFCLKLYSPKPQTKNDENAKKKVSELMIKYIKSPNKLLRFLSVLKGEAAETSKPIEMKLNKFYKKSIIKIINSFEINSDICGEFQQHEIIWQKLFKNFHILKEKKFKKKEYENLSKIGSYIYGNEKYPFKSNQYLIDEFIKNEDLKIFEFFKKQPGLFFRNGIRICCEFKLKKDEEKKQFKNFLEFILKKLKFEQLIELKNVLSSYNKERHFFTKFGTFHFTSNKNEEKLVYKEFNENHQLLLDETLKVIFSKIEQDKKENEKICILDSRLKDVHIPKGKIQEPILNLNKIPANRGDKYYFDKDIILKDDCEVVFFTYWKNGSERVDLDLSVFGLTSNFEYSNQLCDYTRLEGFNHTMFHSGDITDAPKGASEFVRFNIPKLKMKNSNGLKYIVLSTLAFNSIPFENMGDAHVGISYKTKDLKGPGPYDSILIDSCRLSGNAKMNLGAMIDLDELSITFMNMNIPSKKSGISISSSSTLLATCVQKFQSWMSSRSLPSNWFDVSLLFSSSLSTVYLVDDNLDTVDEISVEKDGPKLLEFKKKKDEDVFDFYQRILNKGKDSEKLLKEIELKDDNFYYFGSLTNLNIELPKNSIVLSTDLTIENETVTLLDHPFKLFHLKEEEEEEEEEK